MMSTVDSANSKAKGAPPPGVERPLVDGDTHPGPGVVGGGSSGDAGPHADASHVPRDGHVLMRDKHLVSDVINDKSHFI